MPAEVKHRFDVTKSTLFYEEVKLIHDTAFAHLNELEERSYKWFEEILSVAKKAFQEDDTCLLPKTPSAKRKGRGRVKRTSNIGKAPCRNILDSSQNDMEPDYAKGAKKRDQSEVSLSEDEDFDTPSNKVLLVEDSEDEFILPARTTRATRANSRAAAATTSRAKNTKKASKNATKKKNKSETLIKNLEEDLSHFASPIDEDQIDSGKRSKSNRLSSKEQLDTSCDTQRETFSKSSTPKSEYRVKEKEGVVTEEWIQPSDRNTIALHHKLETEEEGTPMKTTKRNSGKRSGESMEYQETEDIILLSPVQQNQNKKRSQSLPKTPQNTVSASVEALKTPDTIVTNKTCNGVEPRAYSIYEEVVYEEIEANAGVGPNGLPSEKKVPPPRISMTRKSLRASLKVLPSKQKEIEYHAPMQVEEHPVRTRTRLRLKKKDKEENDADGASVSSTERMEAKNDDSDRETETISQDNQTPVGQKTSTRTKTRQTKNTEAANTEDEPAPRKLRSSQENVAAVTTNKDSGVGGSCGSSEDELPRATRSKMRKSPVNNQETEEPRTTRTKTRKRQLDDAETTSSAQSKRSRSCYNHDIDDEDKDTPTNKNYSSDNKSSDSDEVSSPCPRSKVVRPHPKSFLNKFKPLNTKLNTTPLRGAQINPGLMRSFIKPAASKEPTLKEIQEKKKKDLLEKEKKLEELKKKREEEMKKRVEENRKKREEHMRKVQESRQMKAKQEQETRQNLEKKMAEKRNLTQKAREEKLKEDREKQKLRMQKFEDAEERRKREEEETKRKLQEQQEHERIQSEVMQRKKELEEQERHRKMEEERQRALDRQHELEKERERERERLAKIKAAEDEKHREWLKKKEEREKLIVKEKAERERYELEKKKEHDLQLKREMERVREQDKLRLAEQEKIREQQKKQDMELKKMVDKHNAHVQNQHSTLPKPNLNKTHSLTEPTVSSCKERNDSYEMTPDRVHKPATAENYCIDDIKSDDDTDDDEAPRKRVPDWAQGSQLKAILIKQHLHPPNLDLIFDVIEPPDLNLMFDKKKARFNKRTSSAHWDEPILKPGLLGRT